MTCGRSSVMKFICCEQPFFLDSLELPFYTVIIVVVNKLSDTTPAKW